MISAQSPAPAHAQIPAPAPEGAAAATTFDFRKLWHAVLERLWILVLCIVAGGLLAGVYLLRTPKLYQSHTVLEIDVQDPSPVAEDGAMRMRSMYLASQEAMRTIEQNLRNRGLLGRVVRSERLAEDGGKALLGRSITEERAEKATPRPSSADRSAAQLAELPLTPVEEALGGYLSTIVKPVIRRGTRLIDLYVTHQDPAMAQRVAEAVGREYIRFAVERRSTSQQESLRYLLEEEERLKERLQKSEAAIADYKARTPDALQLGGGAASTGSQAGAGSSGGRGGPVEDRLQELNNRLSAARADRAKLEGELNQVELAGTDVDALLAVPSVATAPAVNERRRDVAQLEATVATLAQRYKDRHPKMMAARAALAEAQAALRREAIAAPAILRNLVEQARAAEQRLEIETKEQEKAALALNKAAIGYQELARLAETERALYESVLRQIQQTDLTKGVRTSAISVVERPTLPGAPVSPRPMKALALGLLGGLAAGLGAIFGLNAIDRSIKTVDQAETLFGMSVLAAVPETTEAASGKSAQPGTVEGTESYRLVAQAPEGPAAEAFRNLRATLSLLGPEEERKVFLFTSAVPSEGKSFASANYALSLAQQGHRVLLIDGDLRRPSLHQIFRTGNASKRAADGEQVGVVECLVGASTLEAAVGAVAADQIEPGTGTAAQRKNIVTGLGGELFVLAGGRRSPNPAELLSGSAFPTLIAEASRLFDRVVVDSAPVLAVSDTLLMTPHVQTTCLVVRAAKTSRDAVERAIALLQTVASIRPAGIVLNRLPKGAGAGHYYYYASPGYGSGTYGGAQYSDRPLAGTSSSRGSNGAG